MKANETMQLEIYPRKTYLVDIEAIITLEICTVIVVYSYYIIIIVWQDVTVCECALCNYEYS